MSGIRILVTGATGFVGSHLARRLVREGHEVHVLRRARSDFHRLPDVLPELQAHTVGLDDAAGLRRLLRTVRPERIFHLAAATVVAGVTGSAAELIDVNLLGTARLIDACEAIDYGALVTTGDSFEYTASFAPLREAGSCEPDTLHGITKLGATLYAERVARARHRPILTLRLFSTYGPDDNPRRLVPRVIAGALTGEPIRLSRPEISRDWVYVDDVVDLYLEAGERAAGLGGGVYNAGSGVATSLGEITELLLQLTGSTAAPEWQVFPAPAHDATPWIADTGKTFGAFDWRPRTTLEAGLGATIGAFSRETVP